VRHLFHSFVGQSVDISKWEYLPDFAAQVCTIFNPLKQYFDEKEFAGDTLAAKVKQALAVPWFMPYCAYVRVFGKAVNKLSSYFEGCFCHEETLLSVGTRKKRTKAMMEETESGKGFCPWKVKRLISLAHGKLAELLDEVRMASSIAYRECLLVSPVVISARVVEIEMTSKGRFCSTVAMKAEYYLAIPHKICGAFGEYVGYTLCECKALVRTCFQEYRAISDKTQTDSVTRYFLDEETVVSAQLLEFGYGNPARRLHTLPDAHMAVKEFRGMLPIESIG